MSVAQIICGALGFGLLVLSPHVTHDTGARAARWVQKAVNVFAGACLIAAVL